MKQLVLAFLCVVACLFALPLFFPALHNHAFTFGGINFKWEHCLALGALVLVFKGK